MKTFASLKRKSYPKEVGWMPHFLLMTEEAKLSKK